MGGGGWGIQRAGESGQRGFDGVPPAVAEAEPALEEAGAGSEELRPWARGSEKPGGCPGPRHLCVSISFPDCSPRLPPHVPFLGLSSGFPVS